MATGAEPLPPTSCHYPTSRSLGGPSLSFSGMTGPERGSGRRPRVRGGRLRSVAASSGRLFSFSACDSNAMFDRRLDDLEVGGECRNRVAIQAEVTNRQDLPLWSSVTGVVASPDHVGRIDSPPTEMPARSGSSRSPLSGRRCRAPSSVRASAWAAGASATDSARNRLRFFRSYCWPRRDNHVLYNA